MGGDDVGGVSTEAIYILHPAGAVWDSTVD